MMDPFRNALDYIRSFFGTTLFDRPRKRKADESIAAIFNNKYRRNMSRSIAHAHELDDDWYVKPNITFKSLPIQRIPVKMSTKSPRIIDTVVLNDDDDDNDVIIEKIIHPKNKTQTKLGDQSKHTSTPAIRQFGKFVNGNSTKQDDDDDIAFIKEIKSPKEKRDEAAQAGFKYIKPFTGSLFNIGSGSLDAKPKTRTNILKSKMKTGRNTFSNSPSMNYSFRLNDKLQYQKLIENQKDFSANESSIYGTPMSSLLNYDSANLSSLGKSRTSLSNRENINGLRDRMSTKDTVKKVLDNFEDSIVVKDSDSDSDLILVTPPSPKPDIKVDPVNSIRKVVDTSNTTKPDWLEQVVSRHRQLVEDREKEIQELKECSEKHHSINKDLGLELLRDKVKKCLQIKDAVLPEEEKEEETELPELTDEQLQMVNRAFRGDPNEVLARKFNLNITRRDLQTLAGLNWLNDEVINFYMNLITERAQDSKWPKTYTFNTFFYPKLVRDGPQSLRRWTKRVDIFSYDIICIPVHLGMHWCMAVIDFREKVIKYFDSMGSQNYKCLDALRRYLEAEHYDKKKTEYDTSSFNLQNMEDIPQQMNGSDCGMFACTFAEFITRDAKITFSQEDMPYLRKKMVVEIMVGELLIK